ncbi:hypothetical protein FACS1894187_01700 [Synergistales bacterium]|nr:hypothetical protein FACS1894187_01700 [Synergistales bacterium]
MNAQEIESVVSRVVKRIEGSAGSARLTIPIEASARHVHLNAEAAERLFGKGEVLKKKLGLSQPGEFLAEQRVKIVTSAGEISKAAVLGPLRDSVQVELSATDSKRLGIKPPLNLSGNLKGACDVFLIGDNGAFEAKGSAIIARAHVHLRPEDAIALGLSDGDAARVSAQSRRPVTFDGVIVRVSDNFAPAVHIDFDEANACLLDSDSKAYIMGKSAAGEHQCPPPNPPAANCRNEALITETIARDIVASNKDSVILVGRTTILTPSAKDVFFSAKKTIVRPSEGGAP